MKCYIGCSGFYYKEWKEVFYPKGLAQKDWFRYYCDQFNTIEINSTFYRMPTPKSFQKWYSESPTDFRFSIKAPRLITHYKQLKECGPLLDEFLTIAQQHLANKLAKVLFQFPPKFSFSAERLDLLLSLLGNKGSFAVEFRHESWWQAEVFEQLAQHQITFVGQSFPGELSDELVKNRDDIYYRFHGKPTLYKSEYPPSVIQAFAKQVPETTDVAYIYFNNTWGLGAIHNARQLQALIG